MIVIFKMNAIAGLIKPTKNIHFSGKCFELCVISYRPRKPACQTGSNKFLKNLQKIEVIWSVPWR